MKAFQVTRYGKKEKLVLSEVPVPNINDNEVLVQIYATGINLLDSLIRNGDFKIFLPYKPPFTNGHDMAGVITKVGVNVSKFKVGDEVYARPSDFHIGTFAEFIAISENDLALKPNNISMEESASIPLVGLTSWQALVEITKVQKGQKVFIQAGSGGVGTFAIQLAKHLGAFVATTTSSANTELVKRLGADLIIDYKKEDFSTILKDYDLVLHSNRESKILHQSLQILKQGGTLISLTGPPTSEFAKKIGLGWSFQFLMSLLSMSVKRKAKKLNVNFEFLFMKADGNQLSEITNLIEAGKIRPVIDKEFPFEQTNEGISYIESGRTKGKVVVKVK
ncbi:NADP-dependent oxidoreductase [Leptospira harrisiae]|uniref:NADPH:quinone oxidoreductase n=1 Tax=Leptospira harrisiae TaxID=2023189 RepID=A0A2N0AGR1_9LEPT|nr:NADP-dependent oxidoreductase [Leptospira harrisiae]PJZ83470.1 NADPH:quinone oxidoreductase [Leptospira harrisiae]PKA07062.1 NADPH:quinone oxidoreductase [Leptospira harrisiae]